MIHTLGTLQGGGMIPARLALPGPLRSRPLAAAAALLAALGARAEEADPFVAARARMVETQIAARGVSDPRVLDAMRKVERHRFVPEAHRGEAHGDYPLPIGHGQTISQPYIVALMTELARIRPGDRVLEIGTGSGYQAAVLAHITPHVYSVEIVKALHERARKTLEEQGYKEVECRHGDGHLGWAEKGPFDGVIVTCAPEQVPEPLWEQLKPGGRIVIPIGRVDDVQRLVLVTKTPDGRRKTKTLSAVRFVPMTRGVDTEGK
jgi:protein-L-isoaspartate(D-aspartate) O-methyltransferase